MSLRWGVGLEKEAGADDGWKGERRPTNQLDGIQCSAHPAPGEEEDDAGAGDAEGEGGQELDGGRR